MGPFSVFTVFVVVIYVFGAVDKTSCSFSVHGKIGNFIVIIIVSAKMEFVTHDMRVVILIRSLTITQFTLFVCSLLKRAAKQNIYRNDVAYIIP